MPKSNPFHNVLLHCRCGIRASDTTPIVQVHLEPLSLRIVTMHDYRVGLGQSPRGFQQRMEAGIRAPWARIGDVPVARNTPSGHRQRLLFAGEALCLELAASTYASRTSAPR